MTALEQSLRDLCAKHDLTSLGIDVRHFDSDSGFEFGCYVHWDENNSAAHAFGSSIAGALTSAIEKANKARFCTVVVSLPDEAIEVAA